MNFVCPQCHGALISGANLFHCAQCVRDFPVVGGIADFRLWPDPYIGIDDDRRKGERLIEAAQGRSFSELLKHYYEITAEDPPDLAVRWIAHSLAEVEIAGFVLRESGLGLHVAGGALLDIGCSTGALLIAAQSMAAELVGVDVAFRWLAIAQARLRDAGVNALLVCANAEALPFPGKVFRGIASQDLLEHLRDPQAALSEARRVAESHALSLWTTNNRLTPLPEPHVRLWGVGYLPRRWQARYVAFRRKDLMPYSIGLRSATEIDRLFRSAGYAEWKVAPAPLFAPHRESGLLRAALSAYNRLRRVPFISGLSRWMGPRLWALARR